eukprot:TRINITY_DN578_c0_g1_i3.p1 TRINITY_DN578_c0_g1~~TRINITY_DN578_c0_g1_i3.p1  ORF type:complete len:157 (+),score=12.11 TRINITY_DN578_c0_g1_i3:265-735(+)
METPGANCCPVCKAALGKDKLIPIYGRGGDNKDPRYVKRLVLHFLKNLYVLFSEKSNEFSPNFQNILALTSSRETTPARPPGQRSEPVPRYTQWSPYFSAWHSQVSFGYPFGPTLFNMQMNPHIQENHENLTSEQLQFSRFLMLIGVLLLYFVLLI